MSIISSRNLVCSADLLEIIIVHYKSGIINFPVLRRGLQSGGRTATLTMSPELLNQISNFFGNVRIYPIPKRSSKMIPIPFLISSFGNAKNSCQVNYFTACAELSPFSLNYVQWLLINPRFMLLYIL